MNKETLFHLLVEEFNQKLGRKLTEEENHLLLWVSKVHEKNVHPL